MECLFSVHHPEAITDSLFIVAGGHVQNPQGDNPGQPTDAEAAIPKPALQVPTPAAESGS